LFAGFLVEKGDCQNPPPANTATILISSSLFVTSRNGPMLTDVRVEKWQI
jgi:hypothetical protein